MPSNTASSRSSSVSFSAALSPALPDFATILAMGRFLTLALLLALTSCGPRANPRTAALNANLWMQTSAEYRALCWQTYSLALDRVEREIASGNYAGGTLPLAVVTDLDETVIDNSGYQTWLHFHHQEYSPESWARWVDYQASLPKPAAVPGAVAFLRGVRKLGVTPVFISNRAESSRQATISVLRRLGVDTAGLRDPAGGRMLLRRDGSSKTARRKLVRRRFRVIVWLGDTLADFSGEFEARATAGWPERLRKLEQFRAHLGKDWFLLPNPAYGDWQRALAPTPGEEQLQGSRTFKPER